jgi:hypothetical protein
MQARTRVISLRAHKERMQIARIFTVTWIYVGNNKITHTLIMGN